MVFSKFKIALCSLLHEPQSPLLSGDGQRRRPLLLGLLSSCLLTAAARLEEMRVDEDLPKAALVDDPTADLLPKKGKQDITSRRSLQLKLSSLPTEPSLRLS